MASNVRVVIDKVALNEFRGWTGPIGRSITRLAKEMVYRQRVLSPKDTRAMAASMEWNKKAYSRGIAFEAGSPKSYALFANNGTAPHPITPKSSGGMLVFYWAKVGHVVHLKSVKHPGTQPTHFLERGAEKAMSVWNRAG